MFVHGYSSGNAHSWPCTFCKHCSVQQRFKQKVTAPAKSQTFAEHQVEFHLWCSWALSLMETTLSEAGHRDPDQSAPVHSMIYLTAQAFSTSAMLFGASEDKIRGPPLSLITTSSSILTPRPRKCFGASSFSSLMYNPETRRR